MQILFILFETLTTVTRHFISVWKGQLQSTAFPIHLILDLAKILLKKHIVFFFFFLSC